MSHRQENPSLIAVLREMSDKIARLEKGDKGVRQNDIRLGDMLVTTNADTNQVCITNLNSGTVTCIGAAVAAPPPSGGGGGGGSPDTAVFSWPGLVNYPNAQSPPYIANTSGTFVEMQVAMTAPTAITVQILNGVTVISTHTLTAVAQQNIVISVPFVDNDVVSVKFTGVGSGGASRLSILLRQ